MGLVEDAWQAAVEVQRESKMDEQLARMKADGYDVCKLCGEQVPVYEDDIREDVLRRLTEHANDAPDHVHHSERGWMLVDDLEGAHRAHLADLAVSVRNRSASLLVAVGLAAAAVQFMVGWASVDITATVAVGLVIAVLTVVTLSGTVVAHVYGGWS